jgi:adenylosuccinate synthase
MSSSNFKSVVCCGLSFGDEAKGSIVDYLCRKATNPTVVRFNGGHQAAHNVVLPDGTHHTFSQFGSGTLAGARTHLSRFMLVEPLAMEREAEHLRQIGVADPYSLLTVDEECVVVTPFHRAANRIREAARHRYADEFSFRWSNRKVTDGERFIDAVTNCDGRLKWYFRKEEKA